MSSSFTWIHLSDVHIRASTAWDSDKITAGIIHDLRLEMRDKGLHPDALFFTGDAAFGNDEGESLKAQYANFGKFLDAVRESFDPILEKSRIFIVPGNHDVDRNEVLESDTYWLRHPDRTEKEITAEVRKNSRMCQQWMKRLGAYRQFLIDYGMDHLKPSEASLIWSQKLEIGKSSVAVVGLNSAWSCGTNKEKAALWMAGEWQIGELHNHIGNSDLSFALVHHPSNWLNEMEDPFVGRLLDQTFDVVLHGHEHQEFILQDSAGKLKVSSGACYDRNTYLKGYSIGSMRVDGSGGKLWLRTWDVTGGGWVAKNIANKAPNGCYNINPVAKANESGSSAGALVLVKKDDQIINVSGRPSDWAIKSKVATLRRRPFSFQHGHSRVRINERLNFEATLASGRIGWLVADWQMGKDGFIASTLNSLGSNQALENVYRLDCGHIQEVEDMFEDAGSQLGVTFVEFAALVEHIEQPTLILEDVPSALIRSSSKRSEFIQKLESAVNFVPSLRIIATLRQWPEGVESPRPVILNPFDGHDLLRYLSGHPDGKELLRRRDRLEDVLSHTGGLPAGIDQLISKSNVLPLDDLLDDHTSASSNVSGEAIPKTLEMAVAAVFSPQSENDRRKLSLLKLMTVLKDGETFEGLKRAFRTKPFRTEHVLSLSDSGLIESVPIAKRATTLLSAASSSRHSQVTSLDRLLRVPRQVRDYVETLIPQEERSRIYGTVSESLFGARWYEGKVKLRRAVVLAYRESTVAGPGSELLVAQYLLKTAIERGTKERIKRYSDLAVNYCSELIEEERFRDGMIASRAILGSLDEHAHSEAWVNCAYAYGRAARMTSQHQESVNTLEKLLEPGRLKTKEFIATVNLNLAWCYEKLNKPSDAKHHAQACIQQTHNESDSWFQAAAIIAKIEGKGTIPENVSKRLYLRARQLGHHTAANNIALDWARNSKSKKETIKLLDDVIGNAKDRYNQTRAIVDKANLLRRSNRIGDLTADEQLRLCNAYEYSCAQRIPTLLDSCHDALWEFCVFKGFWAGMFRLFRFSSFVWCLTDRSVKEKDYIAILVEARDDPMRTDIVDVDVEIEYLNRRLVSQDEG